MSAAVSGSGLPPKALERQERLRREKDALYEKNLRGKFEAAPPAAGSVLGEIARLKGEEEEKARGLLEKVWMGSEGKDWKEKRDKREKEALEEGKGYGDLILDQIWEVWSWGKDKNEEVREKDEEVLAEKKRKAEENKR